MKTVQIFRYGNKLKEFYCNVVDLGNKVIRFFDVNGKGGKTIDVYYVGEIIFDVNHYLKTVVVDIDNPDIQIVITW